MNMAEMIQEIKISAMDAIKELEEAATSFREEQQWTGVKVFSATKAREREELGEVISRWRQETKCTVIETVINQSSDSEFHCLSIVVFYR
jgi:hypothetical protein